MRKRTSNKQQATRNKQQATLQVTASWHEMSEQLSIESSSQSPNCMHLDERSNKHLGVNWIWFRLAVPVSSLNDIFLRLFPFSLFFLSFFFLSFLFLSSVFLCDLAPLFPFLWLTKETTIYRLFGRKRDVEFRHLFKNTFFIDFFCVFFCLNFSVWGRRFRFF